jgi:hypothetical protein
MIVDQLVNNVDVGLFHARMLTLLRSTFPQSAMDQVLRQELTNGFQSVYFPPTNNTVGVYYGGDNGRKIMYLDGVVNTAQSAGLVAGYSAYLGLQVINSSNTWIRSNLNTYFDMMNGNHLQTPEYFDMVGYSAGGAVAECMAFNLAIQRSVLKRKVFTYGAPRPGGANVRDVLATTPVVRYMTPADPIPLVPPRLQDAPAIVTVIPIGVALSWSSMVHPHGGIVVTPSGVTDNAILPNEAAINAIGSLANWYFSVDGDPNNPHAMSNYVAYLIRAAELRNRPAEKIIPQAPREVEVVERRANVNRERDRVAKQIAVAQREQNAVIPNEPAVVLFKPTRLGKVWAVVFGEKIVCQGVREDTCRHLCRAGNDFLRSLPKQGIVDVISLSEQLTNFLAYATAEESDWLPKLRTNLTQ